MSSGRHREFDKDQALHQAMLTFWQKGYLGASLSELTRNMGINKPSMYATFGNKEALFLSAVDYYLEKYTSKQSQPLMDESLPLQERLLGFLHTVINMQFDEALPKGCLVSLCSSEAQSGALPHSAVTKINQVRESSRQVLQTFFDQAKASKQLPQSFDSKAHTNAIVLLIHGSAVMSKYGANREEVKASIALLVAGIGKD